MTTQLIFQAPCVDLKNLNNLWLQLSNTTCNLKCKHCYLSCGSITKNKDFLHLDKVKNALENAKKTGVKDIYLTGGEPLLHPDLNTIIRLSLKIANVTILTNGIMLNNKKTRFLRQLDQEFENELIFRISLDHYLEHKNDELRGKGSYKKTLSGIENLIRNGFNPIISAVNIYGEDEDSFKQGFFNLLANFEIEPEDINLKIIPPIKMGEYSKFFRNYADNEIVTNESLKQCNTRRFDCASSRVVTNNGIYVCPILVNDPRGKVGKTLSESSSKFFLETNACYSCQQHNTGIFNNIWSIPE